MSLEERILPDIEGSLIRLGMPNWSDLQGLNSRLGELETKVDSLLSDFNEDKP